MSLISEMIWLLGDYQVRYLDSLYGVYKSREAYSRHAAAIVGLEDIDFWASSLPQL